MPRLVTWDPPTVPFRAEHVPVDRQYLRRAADKGEIVRLRPGVYVAAHAVASTPADRHLQLALAYQMSYPSPIVASHETAAAALGLPLLHSDQLPDQPCFTSNPARGSRRHQRPRVRLAPLPEAQVTHVASGPFEGLRVTSPERTALDLATELPLPQALMALDHVARQRALLKVSARELRGPVDPRVLTDSTAGLRAVAAGLGPRGARRRRMALALTDPRHESPAESSSAAHIFLAGFPAPELQVRFVTTHGPRYADFYWATWKVAGECDGAVKYRGGDSATEHAAADRRRIDEKRRALDLEREHGRVFVPWFGFEALYQPDAFLGPLADALRRRGAQW